MRRCPLSFALTLIVLVTSLAYADSRRVIDYTYDGAGNIISIESSASENPPSIDSIVPDAVRRNTSTSVTVTGNDLRLVEITSTDPAVTVSNVQSTQASVTFDIEPGSAAALGASTLTFETSLGSTTADIQIQPRRPDITVAPTPLVLAIAQALPLNIGLSNIDIFDHTISLSVSDASVATLATSEVTIAAGETVSPTPITITGVSNGTATLTVSSADLGDASFTVFVTEEFVFPVGENSVISAPLGIVLEPDELPPELIDQGPFHAELRVFKEPGPPEPVTTDIDITSPLLGVAFGGGLTSLSPGGFITGANPVSVTVEGNGLDTVTSVSLIPPDDITLTDYTASADGNTATFTIEVAAAAGTGQRQIVFETATGTLQPVTPAADRIVIVDSPPLVFSVEPVVLTRLTSTTLTIRGRNLAPVDSINATPSDGITLGPPVANEDGSVVTLGIEVAEDAPLGDRVITVTMPAGTTSGTPSVNNTITIVNGPATSFAPFFSPLLGVVKGEPIVEPTAVDSLVSPALGVVIGDVVTSLTPSSGIIGTTVNITIGGVGLENVDDVQFVPDDGLIVDTVTPSPDGTEVDVQITIALDAPQNLREVLVLSSGVQVPVSSASVNRFAVTAPLPQIVSINPNFLVAGDPPVELSVFGVNFEDAISVSTLPSDGVSVSAPTVAANGRSLTVTLSTDAGAALGNRAVVVETPAGITSSIATPVNTIAVVDEIVATFPEFVAPLVGVVKEEEDVVEVPQEVLIIAPVVGVSKPIIPPVVETDIGLFSTHLGVGVGTFARRIEPSVVPIDTSFELVIRGVGLENVTDVQIIPADEITLDGPPVALPDGSEVRLPVTVSATAPTTVRQVVVLDSSGAVTFSRADGDRLRIAAGVPLIQSIEPIQEVPGASFVLIIRGFNLQSASNVLAEPADGIVFGNNVTPNADGTEVTVGMSIGINAPLGVRVIQVDTPAGITSATPDAANTFTVVSE